MPSANIQIDAVFNKSGYHFPQQRIIGQHIHLPKWDLVSNDGSGNGWNYEDGTLSPGAVRERIHAINVFNELAASPVLSGKENGLGHLEPQPHPYFAAVGGNDPDWLGARNGIRRYALSGFDRRCATRRPLHADCKDLSFGHDKNQDTVGLHGARA